MATLPQDSFPRPADRDGAWGGRQGQPPAGGGSVRSAALRSRHRARWATPRIHDERRLRLAITADSFVVKPLRFPGGSIGELAVNGTVNDLAVSGARAEALVMTFILEAGLPSEMLEAEVRAMAEAAAAGGRRHRRRRHQSGRARQSRRHVHHHRRDRRARSQASTFGRSPCGPATGCCSPGRSATTASPSCWRAANWISKPTFAPTRARCCRWWKPWRAQPAPGIRWMRDPTRGGVATSLNELARDCGLGVHCAEESIPVRDTVRGACELLGLDPLHIANEGQFLAVVAPEYAEAALGGVAGAPGGRARSIIGEVREQPAGDRSGYHAIWRHARDRHAGGRSAAAHLLG